GSINATASGGTGAKAFSQDGVTFQASGTFNGLAAGPYTVTAKDASGCLASTPATVSAPAQLTVSAPVTNPHCFGGTGSINATASGGTGAKTFSLDGVTFQASGTFNGLAAGPYTVTAKDASGCLASTPATVSAPAQLTVSAPVTNPNCFGGTGSINATASGGTGAKTFSLDGVTFQASGTFNGLAAGP